MRPVTSTDSRLLSKVDNSGFRGPLTRVRLSPTSQGISCPRIRTHRARLRRMSKSTDAPRAKSERSTESAKALLRVASSLDKHSHHGCPDRAENNAPEALAGKDLWAGNMRYGCRDRPTLPFNKSGQCHVGCGLATSIRDRPSCSVKIRLQRFPGSPARLGPSAIWHCGCERGEPNLNQTISEPRMCSVRLLGIWKES